MVRAASTLEKKGAKGVNSAMTAILKKASVAMASAGNAILPDDLRAALDE